MRMVDEQYHPNPAYPQVRRWNEVLSYTESLVQQWTDVSQRPLFDMALRALRHPGPEDPRITIRSTHIPLHVYAAIKGDDAAAVPLTSALLLLSLGIGILDDLADGDLPAYWSVYRPAEINLAAVTLVAALPQLALVDLDAPPTTIVTMQRTLAQSFMRISAGQQRDLAFVGTPTISVKDVEASVVGKWGDVIAVYAVLAAQFAGASFEVVTLYETLGRALGIGWQFAEDCYDLFTAPHSRDLSNGVRTLPVVLYLEQLTGGDRIPFLNLLQQAERDAAAQAEVQQRLRDAGVLRHCAFIIEVYCQRARRILDQLEAQEPGRSAILRMIDTVSFFSASG